MSTSQILRLAAVLLGTVACADAPDGESVDTQDETPTGSEGVRGMEGRTFERHLAFVGTDDDSLVLVPWLFTARTHPGGVARAVQGLVLRGADWEPVFEDSWEDPPTRTPWRVLPRGGLRVLVGLDDALERIVFEDGVRHLELAPGETLTEWSGPRGGVYRLVEGSAGVGDRDVGGVVLDVSRSVGPGEPAHGDWAFLVSGDSLQVVLHSPRRVPPGSGAWRGWGRLDFRELRWPVLTVEWPDVRAFERARRDVPVAWRITSPAEEVAGELSTSVTRVEAGEGDGPQLPVRGLFAVRGVLTVEGGEYPVEGLLYHVQG